MDEFVVDRRATLVLLARTSVRDDPRFSLVAARVAEQQEDALPFNHGREGAPDVACGSDRSSVDPDDLVAGRYTGARRG